MKKIIIDEVTHSALVPSENQSIRDLLSGTTTFTTQQVVDKGMQGYFIGSVLELAQWLFPETLCEFCKGTGKIEVLEHVDGDNVVPGGFYQGSGVFKPCVCKLE